MSEENVFSKKDTYEYLNDLPLAVVRTAMVELGYDPDSETFPVNIVDMVRETVAALRSANAQVQALSPAEPASQDAGLIVKETSAIAAEILDSHNISVPQEVLLAVAQATVTQARHEAEVLSRLREQAFVKTMQRQQTDFSQRLMRAMQDSSQEFGNIFNDETQLKLVERAVPTSSSIDVAEFLAEVRGTEKARCATRASQKRAGEEFVQGKQTIDVDAFLEEFYG